MTFAERKKFTYLCRCIVEEKNRGKLLERFDELQRFFDTISDDSGTVSTFNDQMGTTTESCTSGALCDSELVLLDLPVAIHESSSGRVHRKAEHTILGCDLQVSALVRGNLTSGSAAFIQVRLFWRWLVVKAEASRIAASRPSAGGRR